MEFVRQKKDGSPIDVSISAAPIYDSAGRVAGQISVVIDITRQKKMELERVALEGQLRQSQKMEAIGQLAGGVAHDFNNILSAIVGYSQLTLMTMSESDQNYNNIQQILTASDRATVLTQRLLSFSRKQTVNLIRTDLNDIITRFETFLLRLMREDIELETTLAGQELIVMADRSQVEQVLLNLVTNSLDAMPNGGRINIKTGVARFDQSQSEAQGLGRAGEYALFSVTDTGIGISEDIKNRIFDPFFTTKETGKGTGLGLSMAYGIVEKHEGFIDVHSRPGIGTTFTIYLPMIQVRAEAEEPKTDGQERLRKGFETILLAEDDSAVRTVSAKVLRSYGYTVIEAVDGLDAIEKFKEARTSIRLVVLDGIMPKKNGKQAWQEIESLAPGIKAIFISGYAEDIFTKDGIPEEKAAFIQKPVSPLVLVKKVRDALDA